MDVTEPGSLQCGYIQLEGLNTRQEMILIKADEMGVQLGVLNQWIFIHRKYYTKLTKESGQSVKFFWERDLLDDGCAEFWLVIYLGIRICTISCNVYPDGFSICVGHCQQDDGAKFLVIVEQTVGGVRFLKPAVLLIHFPQATGQIPPPFKAKCNLLPFIGICGRPPHFILIFCNDDFAELIDVANTTVVYLPAVGDLLECATSGQVSESHGQCQSSFQGRP